MALSLKLVVLLVCVLIRTTTSIPTGTPTSAPTTFGPTTVPTTFGPTTVPTTFGPTDAPTTPGPTGAPTTGAPTTVPTTFGPTDVPTTFGPTDVPTTFGPTDAPTTPGPTISNAPTTAPTPGPTTPAPSRSPTGTPTGTPTSNPPTACPSCQVKGSAQLQGVSTAEFSNAEQLAFRESIAAGAGDWCTKDEVSIVEYSRRGLMVSFTIQTPTEKAASEGRTTMTNYLSSTAFATELKSHGGGLAGVITAAGVVDQPEGIYISLNENEDSSLNGGYMAITALSACAILALLIAFHTKFFIEHYEDAENNTPLVPNDPLTLAAKALASAEKNPLMAPESPPSESSENPEFLSKKEDWAPDDGAAAVLQLQEITLEDGDEESEDEDEDEEESESESADEGSEEELPEELLEIVPDENTMKKDVNPIAI